MVPGDTPAPTPNAAPAPKPPVQQVAADANPVITESWWQRRRLWFRRIVTGETRLDMLTEQVALGWRASDPAVRDLLISLEAKWQASREEARRATLLAAISFAAALAALVWGVIALWWGRDHSYRLVDAVSKSPAFTPDHTLVWQALIVTSGSVLLFVAIATLLLKVADRYAHLARQHSADADCTRRLEAGIRIAMAFGAAKVDKLMDEKQKDAALRTADHYNAVALKLLEGTSTEFTLPEALPDALKELGKVLVTVQKALPKAE
jgi:hypothetical protein